MGMCKQCGTVVSSLTMIDGLCEKCQPTELKERQQAELDRKKAESEENKAREQAEQEKYRQLNYNRSVSLGGILVTTEMTTKYEMLETVEFVSVSRIYGINIVKDFFSGIRDIVGGRVNSLESSLNAATKEIIEEMQEKAYIKDANAVIAVKIEHTYNNAGGGSILSVLGTGTIVRLQK